MTPEHALEKRVRDLRARAVRLRLLVRELNGQRLAKTRKQGRK